MSVQSSPDISTSIFVSHTFRTKMKSRFYYLGRPYTLCLAHYCINGIYPHIIVELLTLNYTHICTITKVRIPFTIIQTYLQLLTFVSFMRGMSRIKKYKQGTPQYTTTYHCWSSRSIKSLLHNIYPWIPIYEHKSLLVYFHVTKDGIQCGALPITSYYRYIIKELYLSSL